MPWIFTFKKRIDKLNNYILEDQNLQDRNPFFHFQDD